MIKTLSLMMNHPLTRDRPHAAISRFVRWQIESRLKQEVLFNWIEGSKLIVRNGMTGATGNIYCGLHEFEDMAFLLHFLRPDDLFVDVGANIGSYTILASYVCGAHSIAVEPDPDTMNSLKRNIAANGLELKVTPIEMAIGSKTGDARFTVGRDTVNQIADDLETNVRVVKVERLDELLRDKSPVLIKLDVEGYEAEVIAGALQTLMASSLLAIETEGRQPEVKSGLERAGFKEYSYDPWSRKLIAAEGKGSNALYLRDEATVCARLSAAPRRRVLNSFL